MCYYKQGHYSDVHSYRQSRLVILHHHDKNCHMPIGADHIVKRMLSLAWKQMELKVC